MEKKQVRHFVPDKDIHGNGYPACNCYGWGRRVLVVFGEIAKTRRGVTCGRCRNTAVFRG